MTTLPAPLPLAPVDFLIILAIEDGHADTTVGHLPAKRNGRGPYFTDYDEPPARWASACGDVIGWVYNRGGTLEHIDICADCEMAA